MSYSSCFSLYWHQPQEIKPWHIIKGVKMITVMCAKIKNKKLLDSKLFNDRAILEFHMHASSFLTILTIQVQEPLPALENNIQHSL